MRIFYFCVAVFVAVTGFVAADEGMWLFSNPPLTTIAEKYGVKLSDEWLTHVQQSCVRFPNGSGSFVSPNGLVLTNHHVGARQINELSTPENDLLANGFTAQRLEDEMPCKNAELVVLISTLDVTDKVNAAVTSEMSLEDAEKSRRAVMSRIENEESDATGLKCEIVTLYQGGAYHLYRYKRYTDVRLVWAPEQQIAAFGGDTDNFEYPRYCLDAALFRVYEDNKPASTPQHLKWNTHVTDDELVFVAGHPGRTQRALFKDHLQLYAYGLLPRQLDKLFRNEVLFSVFAERSAENLRRIKGEIDGVKNSRKLRYGQMLGLASPELWKVKIEQDRGFLDKTRAERLETILRRLENLEHAYTFYEGGEIYNSRLFGIARTLVRMADELEKPSEERLREYRDSNLVSLKHSLFSEAPIYADVEQLKITDAVAKALLTNWTWSFLTNGLFDRLGNVLENVDKNDPDYLESWVYVYLLPHNAASLPYRTKLADVAERKRLAEGGREAIEKSDDPMIRLARALDQTARKVRKQRETEVDEPLRQLYAEVANERFAKYGTSVYPDATFTLRLSYGQVKGYTEDDGEAVPAWTKVAGLYARESEHKSSPPFDLPPKWSAARERLDAATPVNLVTTNDIIGGNSGSPLVNASGEIVGLVFDGNLQSLTADFLYTDVQSRTVCVHAAFLIEALRKVYGAERIVKEIKP
ncbi:MAG: S46 family peptidase [Thermoguttaceae bacterium]